MGLHPLPGGPATGTNSEVSWLKGCVLGLDNSLSLSLSLSLFFFFFFFENLRLLHAMHVDSFLLVSSHELANPK